MYASSQLVTVHHEEMLRAAAARRLVSEAKAALVPASPRHVRAQVTRRRLRFGRLVSQS